MENTRAKKPSGLDVSFRAKLTKSPQPGGWTYVVWPQSTKFFQTRGLVKVSGTIDGLPFRSAFMALGDGRHMLPVRESLRVRLEKTVGDTVDVELHQRLN